MHVKYIFIVSLFGGVLFYGCTERQSAKSALENPNSQQANAVAIQYQQHIALDSLREEVRALREIVRRLNVVDVPDSVIVCGMEIPMKQTDWPLSEGCSAY